MSGLPQARYSNAKATFVNAFFWNDDKSMKFERDFHRLVLIDKLQLHNSSCYSGRKLNKETGNNLQLELKVMFQ